MNDKTEHERPDFTKAEQAAAERALDRAHAERGRAREKAPKPKPKPKP